MLISLDQSNPPEEPLSGPSSKKLKRVSANENIDTKSNVMFVEQ